MERYNRNNGSQDRSRDEEMYRNREMENQRGSNRGMDTDDVAHGFRSGSNSRDREQFERERYGREGRGRDDDRTSRGGQYGSEGYQGMGGMGPSWEEQDNYGQGRGGSPYGSRGNRGPGQQYGGGGQQYGRGGQQYGGQGSQGRGGESYGFSGQYGGTADQGQGAFSGGREQSFRGKGPKGYTRTDERIQEEVSERLSDDDAIDASDIEVKVDGGEVKLSGTVSSRRAKHQCEDLCASISGVKDVENHIRVKRDDNDTSTSGSDSGGRSSKGSTKASS